MDVVTTSSDLNLYGMIACQESPIRVDGERKTELLDHQHHVDHGASNNVLGKDNGFNLLPEVNEVSTYCDSSTNGASNSLEVSACQKVHVLAPFPPPRSHNFFLITKENNNTSRYSSFPKKRQRIGSVDKKKKNNNNNNNGRTTVYEAMESFIENIFNCAGGGCNDIVGMDADITNEDKSSFASVPMEYKSNTNKKSSSSKFNNSSNSSNDKENDSTSLNETGSTYQGSYLNDESHSSWRIIGSTSPANSRSSLPPSPRQRRKEGDYEYAEQQRNRNQQQIKLEPPLQPPDIRRLSTNGQVNTTKINGSSLPLPRSKSLDFLFSSSSPYPHINHHYYEEKHSYPDLLQQQCHDNRFRVVGMIEEPRDEYRWWQQHHHNRNPNAGNNSRISIKGMVEISQPHQHEHAPTIQQAETSGLNETYMTL